MAGSGKCCESANPLYERQKADTRTYNKLVGYICPAHGRTPIKAKKACCAEGQIAWERLTSPNGLAAVYIFGGYSCELHGLTSGDV